VFALDGTGARRGRRRVCADIEHIMATTDFDGLLGTALAGENVASRKKREKSA
jgi:hypothetical protein